MHRHGLFSIGLLCTVTKPSIAALLRPTLAQQGKLLSSDTVKRAPLILAQNGWATGIDEASGRQYYYNELTGESQWDPPAEQGYAEPSHLAAAHDGWITAVDEASGHTYFYNERTGQSQWDPPQGAGAQVLFRLAGCSFRNALNELSGVAGFTGVAGFEGEHATLDYELDHSALPYTLCNGDERVLSRWNMIEQKLTVSRKQCIVTCAGGRATLTSEGKGPTLWRERAGPWVALQKGEEVVLTDGDQVSLDCNDPEAAVFTCEDVQQDGYRFAQEGLGASSFAAA